MNFENKPKSNGEQHYYVFELNNDSDYRYSVIADGEDDAWKKFLKYLAEDLNWTFDARLEIELTGELDLPTVINPVVEWN